jgi:hypothetical protein
MGNSPFVNARLREGFFERENPNAASRYNQAIPSQGFSL